MITSPACWRWPNPVRRFAAGPFSTGGSPRRYGLGFAKPAPLPIKPYLASGYLKRGQTILKLAQACGIDPDGLARTVEAYNRHARNGEDPEFGRGSTPYERAGGDPAQ